VKYRIKLVLDLRKAVASAVEKKEEQMVLIFGGKILKDTDTVETHSIKDGQAVHLVVKQPRQEDPKPAAETPASAPASGSGSTATTTTPSSTTRASPTAASTNPFAGLFTLITQERLPFSALAGGMAGSGGMGQNMQQQAQQMMQNPQAMQEMMNSPMMQV
jgi:ubiquilin